MCVWIFVSEGGIYVVLEEGKVCIVCICVVGVIELEIELFVGVIVYVGFLVVLDGVIWSVGVYDFGCECLVVVG